MGGHVWEAAWAPFRSCRVFLAWPELPSPGCSRSVTAAEGAAANDVGQRSPAFLAPGAGSLAHSPAAHLLLCGPVCSPGVGDP